jgi:hypothetical protein
MTSLGLLCRDRKPSARNLEFKRALEDDEPSIRVIYTDSPKAAQCIITVWDREKR